ncbi:MAG TPA: hypothetical protein VHC01_05350 [Gaiellaceae bacterium]|nr:hypothetical protein [Gaiellaceae bacterium]
MKRIVVVAAVALVAAGCGKPGTKLYTEQASAACLQKAGVKAGPVGNSDFVASSATGGAFRAPLTDNEVTVSFGETLTDADNIDQAYRRFRAKNVGIDDVLRTQGNAIMLWHQHPTDADIATITGCLSS